MTVSDNSSPVLVWFRDDLRLADNPALHAAMQSGQPLICIYIREEVTDDGRPMGAAARWWLHGALAALDESLREKGGALHILAGSAAGLVEKLVVTAEVHAVYWNRRYDRPSREIDTRIKASLKDRGIEAHSFNGTLVHEPWAVKSASGTPFKVFTPYWRAARQLGTPEGPLRKPASLRFAKVPQEMQSAVVDLASLKLEPVKPDWAGGMRAAWHRGEEGARRCLDGFIEHGLEGYAGDRDRMNTLSVSRLSPFLRFGNISVRQIWHAVAAAHLSGETRASERDIDKFLSELGWREFAYHLLYHSPPLHEQNLQRQFDAMPWRTDKTALGAWQRGQTGYPLVDAGMRELWTTGWMHNRVRMVTASFLTKHLLLDWREGESWFWDTLVDADIASNPMNWQWVAGSGADAAPFFRILNPVLQGEKFDTQGDYVRRWVPELAGMPSAVIHHPWTASEAQLAAGGIKLGETYPAPIVEHDMARRRALETWREMRGSTGGGEDE